jgi:hypothetical protein
MLDFDVQRPARRCSKTDKEFKAGETFYSVLVSEGAELVRYDYAQDAWNGPPEEAIGWWISQVPSPTASKVHWAPNDVILHYFRQLLDQSENRDTLYVLALLMIRRRIVRQVDTETDEDGETIVLHCQKDENDYRVPVCVPTESRAAEIQDELARLLVAKAS